jgi:type VI secretion system protein ImpM
MPAFGYFGKVPAMPDFVFHGLSMRAIDAWSVHLTYWLAAGRKAAAEDWTRRFLSSPVWRFAVSSNVFGPDCWVGLLAGSADSVGREFPFIVMMTAGFDPAQSQPIRMLDARLDPVEELALAFMEGHASQAELVKATSEAAAAIERDLDAGVADGTTSGLIIPHENHDAVCFSHADGEPREGKPAAYSWPAAKNNKHAANLCLWWHEGSEDRAADFCVTRGMPPHDSASAFFLGDWETHGWARRDAATYLGKL